MQFFYLKWLKFSVVALFAAAFIALILYVVFMQDVIRSSDVEPPLISAPTEPVKRRPDQPGGMQIPNQDKLVFDLLDTSGTEQPLLDDAMVKETAETDVEELAVAEPVAVVPVVSETVKVAVVPSATVVEKKPEPIVAAKVEIPVEKKIEETKAPTTTGAWGVQLASVKAKADADAALKKLANQFPALRSLDGRVQSATVNGSTSYRIQFVGSDTREAASALCKTLGTKQACFPVKR